MPQIMWNRRRNSRCHHQNRIFEAIWRGRDAPKGRPARWDNQRSCRRTVPRILAFHTCASTPPTIQARLKRPNKHTNFGRALKEKLNSLLRMNLLILIYNPFLCKCFPQWPSRIFGRKNYSWPSSQRGCCHRVKSFRPSHYDRKVVFVARVKTIPILRIRRQPKLFDRPLYCACQQPEQIILLKKYDFFAH